MTNTKSHAQIELEILRKTTPDAIVLEFEKEILELCEAFGNSGQSGGSAPYTAGALSQAIKKLCLQKTIAPLTGEDSEFNNNIDKETYQNNRDSAVFKKDDKAYYLDAITWQVQDDYDTFSGSVNGISSRQYIKSFPFTPKTFYIDVVREDWNDEKHNNGEWDKVEFGPGPMAYQIKDKKQLEQVFEYYDKFN